MHEAKKWYQSSDILVRGRNAYNSVLIQMLGFLIAIGLQIVDNIRMDEPIDGMWIVIFVLFFIVYLITVYGREYMMADRQNSIDQIHLAQIREITRQYIDKKIGELEYV